MAIYIFRVSSGREKGVAKMVFGKGLHSKRFKGTIYSLVVSDAYRGYLIIEGSDLKRIEEMMSTIRGVSQHALGGKEVSIEELSEILVPRSAVEGLALGDLVEIINGPFKGSTARLTRIDGSNQVTAEIVNSTLSLPISVHADSVRKIASD